MNPMQDPLAALRPLHTPHPISWWPPAPGWWIIGALAVIIPALFWWYLRRTRLRRTALGELKEIRAMAGSTEEKVRNLALLLKRYVLVLYPEKEVAGLTGEDWLRFLDEKLGQSPGPFQQGAGRVFGTSLYGEKIESDCEQLCSLVSLWIKKNRLRG